MQQTARTSKQLGSIIRRARKAAGLSQTALGEKAGVWQETVSRIETGQASTRVDTIVDILAALQLEIEIRPRQDDMSSLEDRF
ncbi:MAG: transcriptional regulator [Rhizobiaceae bacterium MnEN-MB40S]|nr:MAG: transcriptional regulator [Rhizobiaceae bacterium MnEN-MB40S]